VTIADVVPGLAFAPLTPLSFLERAERSHGDRLAVVDGDLRLTYAELADRCRRLAGVVRALSPDAPVAVLGPNSHLLLESHFGVPWAATPLVALNTRLSVDELVYILGHCDAGMLLCDESLVGKADAIRERLGRPLEVLVDGGDGAYEAALDRATPTAIAPSDERSLLSINYTSGTTGRPKGVMYHHRGAYLQALAMLGHTGLSPSAVHLWTLPMFHCNGWCFPWAVTAAAARHVCLRQIDADEVWDVIDRDGVTHFEAAPTVLTMLAYARAADPAARLDSQPLRVCVGGAPPSPAILERMAELRVDVTHLYGLTETFGPAAICDWRPEWDELDTVEQVRKRTRQGVGNVISQGLRVLDRNGADVSADAATLGEIALRGNNVMLGYYKDPEATKAAAPDGWFRTGDLAVLHPDGYVEIRDRLKDVIISGGENVSSVEVEHAILSHAAVREAAVVGRPHERWGEVPVAFVTLHPHAAATEEEIRTHVRERLAGFKAPHRVFFGELPKTATGKIQKFRLRERAS
jgi:fatty-acyl-CoA synthase